MAYTNGSFLVLLDLSAAFDTIDHDNLFYILEKYVGIVGSAIRLIRSYFSDRTQRVQIDILSDFASLLYGVPQGSVSVLIFSRTLLGYYAEGMHANF